MTGDGAQNVGYDKEIKPLFREKDRDAMRRAFDLWSYTDVVAHSEAIAQQLSEGTMPCDGPWPADHVELFQRWMKEGSAE
jgi:hypothetical protein